MDENWWGREKGKERYNSYNAEFHLVQCWGIRSGSLLKSSEQFEFWDFESTQVSRAVLPPRCLLAGTLHQDQLSQNTKIKVLPKGF